ncbi:hypothetical protein NL676_016182 [Syzygium grande]|nr:hypothetical protein NL676_016182 [Syzygium grande]
MPLASGDGRDRPRARFDLPFLDSATLDRCSNCTPSQARPAASPAKPPLATSCRRFADQTPPQLPVPQSQALFGRIEPRVAGVAVTGLPRAPPPILTASR